MYRASNPKRLNPIPCVAALAVLLATPVLGSDVTLVADGEARATIVLAREPTQAAQFAAWELQEHVRKITGATLPMAYGTHASPGARILVGESQAARDLGLTTDDLREQEYLIRFLPETVVLMGRDDAIPAPADRPVAAKVGGVGTADGRLGRAFGFDKGAVVVSDCGFNDAVGSMEAWVWLPPEVESPPNSATILRLDGTEPWTYHILDCMPGACIRYVTYRAEPRTAGSVRSGTLSPGWHHVLAAYDADAGQMELFVDRESQGTAKYVATTCGEARLRIGGLPGGRGKVNNPFSGRIDEVRISNMVRDLADTGGPYELDGNTTCLVHFDDDTPTVLHHRDRVTFKNTPPRLYQGQATCYAVYDFLERFCDVRWYAPGELGLVCPRQRTLRVQGRDLQRRPAFLWRHSRCVGSAYGLTQAIWGDPSAKEVQAFARRLRYGGEPYACNHSFYGYYDRFLETDSPAFEVAHPEYFGQGYEGKPPQLCYTNPAVLRQVVEDARQYFASGVLKAKARAQGDYFALVPMDNSRYCQCNACKALVNHAQEANEQFSNGLHSDYVFSFVNAVAREVGKYHPGRHLAALAYSKYAYYPTTLRLEPNVSVQMCLTVRHCWAPLMKKNDLRFYRDWVSKDAGRRLFVWLYYCFPELSARAGFHCFPGFFAHTADEWFKRFHRDGVRGIGLGGGLGELVDTYVTSKLMDDPTLNMDRTLDELFERFYGPAGEPLKRMYLTIEKTYCDPANYPEEVRTEDRTFHQTEEIAWGHLGTEVRMAELAALMARAKAAPTDAVQTQRVALFEKAIWEYMVEGRRKYVRNQELVPFVEKLKKAPLPSARVPRSSANHGGDPLRVDFSQGVALAPWYTVMGYPARREVSARAVHDGRYLYLKLNDPCDATKLVSYAGIWNGDDWELFFAPARAKPYRQLGINPAGKFKGLAYGEADGVWAIDAKIHSSKHERGWTVLVALPLAQLLPAGAKPGTTLYANLIRSSPGSKEPLAWSAHFKYNFHMPERLGALTLE